ncbi:MAG: class I tRNA ligase family protein, partial [Elusimicrobia bacterium]|nr:class I tRNA ligase family protein [Elusimicrobiota bacterium]
METDYSKTVNLPKTQFPMRADLPKREPVQIGLWESRGVYRKMLDRAKDGAFVLHDGPPYANGHIHIGHALNKILKDMVVKSRALAGLRTPYVPGWDCHGLPIEHALLKEMKMDKRAVKDIVDFRAKARHFAKKFIDIQREEFRRLEILGDWFRPYDTMSHSYEARVLRAFRLLFEKGYIYRGLKSVGWCFHCETALAEAEVEYREKLSPSIYVALPVASSAPIEEALRQEGGCGPARAEVVVWTTTPWTLPGNMAVAFHPDLDYVLAKVQLQAESSARYLVLGRRRLEPVLEAIGGKNLGIFGSWKGSELARADVQDTGGKQSFCERPFKIGDGKSLFVMADYVTAEDGTGIVHTAPGHGPDDFNTGRRYGLEILSPVDGAGRFTPEADAFKDFRIFPDGNESVCEALARAGRLLFQGTITHSYQHCWRCKNPIIFRATEQWFLNVAHEGLREKLLKAVGEVAWIPEASKARISSMIESRPDWCLSRQRLWGTPIPILYCAGCGEILKDLKVMEAIERQV